MTSLWSSERSTVFTTPITTSLYLTKVLPASNPSPDLKEMVIVEPRSRMTLTPKPMPTSKANIGMIQIKREDQFRGCLAMGRGRLLNPGSGFASEDMIFLGDFLCFFRLICGLPEEAWVKTFSSKHGQHNHGTKGESASANVDRHNVAKLYKRRQHGCHININHRPPSDGFQNSVHLRTDLGFPYGTSAYRNQ